ncbi:phosphotransferase family protein [Georgenia subflava]|uniref:phosphotransferase family protein n=1 Tax=Georgenia subflava TaxID=1622177 RepID=UPI0012652167|nr:phosphotransferase [Georgenia subflava]
MLLPDDHRLIASEPDLPGLGTVLDPPTLLGRLGPAWGRGDAVAAEVTYLRHKPGTSVVVGLTVRTADGSTHLAYAVAHRLDAPAKLDKLRDAGARDLAGRGVALDRALGIALVDATADRHLPGVRSLLAADADATEALVYKPARRWVAVQRPATGVPSLVKIHRPTRTYDNLVGHRLLHGTRVPVPRVLEVRPGQGLIRTEFVPGAALDRIQPAPPGAWAGAGELLATLHALGPSGDAVEVNRGAGLAAAVSAVRSAVPTAVAQARETVELVRSVLVGRDVRTVVHGDFSADQVIVRPDLARAAAPEHGELPARPGQAPLTLVDLDRVGVDDPLADVASWAAHEIVSGRTGGASDPVTVLGPVLDGYTASGGLVDERALAALTAGALLQRAVEPFRTHQPDWGERVTTLVDTAHRLAVAAHGSGARRRRPEARRAAGGRAGPRAAEPAAAGGSDRMGVRR